MVANRLSEGSVAMSLLAAFEGVEDQSLISAQGRAELVAAAQNLPATISSFVAFECRLGERSAKADLFLFCGAGTSHMAELRSFACEAASAPAWKTVADACDLVDSPDGAFGSAPIGLWLEFDVAEGDASQPSCFFAPIKLEAADIRSVAGIKASLARLRVAPLLPAEQAAFVRCVIALPTQGSIFAVGIMTSRPGMPFRVCVKGVDADLIPAYLDSIRWPGDGMALERAIGRYASNAGIVGVAVELSERGVESRLGLEFRFQDLQDHGSSERFIKKLCEDGLCLPEKAAGLLTWPRVVHLPSPPSGRLEGLTGKAIVVTNPTHLMDYQISHLKITIEPDGRSSAKAYFGAVCMKAST